MIETLHIENIGIIDNITVDFKKGLNIITGETGAGKSLLVDALSLICGSRFSKDVIKTGENYCLVEIMINKDSNTENDIVSREISVSGKNKCKINGRLVTVNELKEYMSHVINIHGQNDNQNLLDESNHITYLDAYAKDELLEDKEEYTKLYNEYLKFSLELKENFGSEKERKRMLDLLDYEINEIEEANFKVGEEEQLEEKSKIMRNAEKINEALNISEELISSEILNNINEVVKNLNRISQFNNMYKKQSDRIEGIYYDLEDMSQELFNYKEELSFDENYNNDVIKRLDLLYSLKRKYGNNIEEILKYKESNIAKKEEIENMEEHLNEVQKKLENIQEKMYELSCKMSSTRKDMAKKLQEKINIELSDLEMKNARIKVNVEFSKDRNFKSSGLDNVSFKIITNLGDDYKSLSKIASGGEISRIMLAIKNVLSKTDSVPVLIFDEVDTGISGKSGSAVGLKLKEVSKNHQVLCITHLAVVAAYADYHYYISKKSLNNHTSSKIELLDDNMAIKEIARISSGTITTIALDNARELKKVACLV